MKKIIDYINHHRWITDVIVLALSLPLGWAMAESCMDFQGYTTLQILTSAVFALPFIIVFDTLINIALKDFNRQP